MEGEVGSPCLHRLGLGTLLTLPSFHPSLPPTLSLLPNSRHTEDFSAHGSTDDVTPSSLDQKFLEGRDRARINSVISMSVRPTQYLALSRHSVNTAFVDLLPEFRTKLLS